MNPFARFKDNPGFENIEDHGDLWDAIHKCYTRVAVVDERIRVALLFSLPIVGLVMALLATVLGLLIGHVVDGGVHAGGK